MSSARNARMLMAGLALALAPLLLALAGCGSGDGPSGVPRVDTGGTPRMDTGGVRRVPTVGSVPINGGDVPTDPNGNIVSDAGAAPPAAGTGAQPTGTLGVDDSLDDADFIGIDEIEDFDDFSDVQDNTTLDDFGRFAGAGGGAAGASP